MDKQTYWRERAATYDALAWVRDDHALGVLVDTMAFEPHDVVLDAGTGLGAVAAAISHLVAGVVGVDASRSMLERARKVPNVDYVCWDILNPLFHEGVFDKVTMRQVLHHIHPEDMGEAIAILYGVLKPGGRIGIVEPVCALEEVEEEYATIMALKDNRTVLSVPSVVALLSAAGFGNLRSVPFSITGFDVRNWLSNNALPQEIQDRLFELHVTASPRFKEAYNMRITNGNCFIDTANAIITGVRP